MQWFTSFWIINKSSLSLKKTSGPLLTAATATARNRADRTLGSLARCYCWGCVVLDQDRFGQCQTSSSHVVADLSAVLKIVAQNELDELVLPCVRRTGPEMPGRALTLRIFGLLDWLGVERRADRDYQPKSSNSRSIMASSNSGSRDVKLTKQTSQRHVQPYRPAKAPESVE